jgi:phytoene dehydrogenase-like protein
MAGLTCAHYLRQAGVPVQVLEASDAVGGRVRTDRVEGFQLDRGFQILLTAYPEAKRLLDYPALRLGAFRSGAVVRCANGFEEVADPRRALSGIFKTLKAPIGSLADKMRVLKLIADVKSVATASDFFKQPDQDSLTFLREYGWSDRMINSFFRPFFGGIFLEDNLITSSNFLRFVFRQFYEGEAALPAAGMQAIPEQLAAALPAGSVRLNTPVAGMEGTSVRLASGEAIRARQVVLATDARAADHLLGTSSSRSFNTTTCTYFAADRSPLPRKMLILNPDVNSVVHHIGILSDVTPTYAPEGKTLISVSSQGPGQAEVSEEKIRLVLKEWFGEEVLQWRYLRAYRVKDALVRYGAGSRPEELRLREGLYRCGDYTAYPSLNAAMQTGREVAHLITST